MRTVNAPGNTLCPVCEREHLTGDVAAKYTRISEDREGLELGVERQSEDVDKLACQQNVLICYEYEDNDIGASTRSNKLRPDYDRMIKDARTGAFEIILAYTSKRITRRPREHEDLIELGEQYGMRYAYVRSPSFDLNTANGRMVARILAAQDANESEEIGERVSRAAEQRIRNGGFHGGNRRYGFEPDGITRRDHERVDVVDVDKTSGLATTEFINDECAEIVRAAEAVLAGVSLRALARDLNKREKSTTEGKRWDSLAVRAMLLRERNAGLLVYRGEIVEGVDAPWGAIVPDGCDDPRAFWEGVWSVLKDSSRKTSPGNKPRWLLSGLGLCLHQRCVDEGKQSVVRQGGTRPNRADAYPAYRCVEYGHNRLHAEKADEHVGDVITAYLAKPEAAKLLDTSEQVDTSTISAEIAVIRARIDESKELWQEGIFSASELKQRVRRLNEQLAPLEEQLAAASEVDPLVGIAGESNAPEIWERLDLGRKRAIVDRLVTIKIKPAKRGRLPGGQYFDFERILFEWKGLRR